MGEMPESLKKIAVGNVLGDDTVKPGLSAGGDHRGRGTQEEDQNAKLDK